MNGNLGWHPVDASLFSGFLPPLHLLTDISVILHRPMEANTGHMAANTAMCPVSLFGYRSFQSFISRGIKQPPWTLLAMKHSMVPSSVS